MLDRSRSALLCAALALCVAACGAGDDEDAAALDDGGFAPATSPATPDEIARAATALIRVEDLGVGWAEEPIDPEAPPELSARIGNQIVECAGMDARLTLDTAIGAARAHTGTFESDDGPRVTQLVGLAPNESVAASAIGQLRLPDVSTCSEVAVQSVVQDALDAGVGPAPGIPAGADIGSVTVERVNYGSAGDELLVLRTSIPFAYDGEQAVAQIDTAFVREGRALSRIEIASVDDSISQDDSGRLIKLAAERLQTALER